MIPRFFAWRTPSCPSHIWRGWLPDGHKSEGYNVHVHLGTYAVGAVLWSRYDPYTLTEEGIRQDAQHALNTEGSRGGT